MIQDIIAQAVSEQGVVLIVIAVGTPVLIEFFGAQHQH